MTLTWPLFVNCKDHVWEREPPDPPLTGRDKQHADKRWVGALILHKHTHREIVYKHRIIYDIYVWCKQYEKWHNFYMIYQLIYNAWKKINAFELLFTFHFIKYLDKWLWLQILFQKHCHEGWWCFGGTFVQATGVGDFKFSGQQVFSTLLGNKPFLTFSVHREIFR